MSVPGKRASASTAGYIDLGIIIIIIYSVVITLSPSSFIHHPALGVIGHHSSFSFPMSIYQTLHLLSVAPAASSLSIFQSWREWEPALFFFPDILDSLALFWGSPFGGH
jgi:hypothetical protein